MTKFKLSAAALLCGAVLFPAFGDEPLRQEALRLFGRIDPPAATSLTTAEVALGRALFWDTRLSLDGKTACASCHAAADWGADRRPASIDAKGLPTSRHSPTVFNTMGQPTLRWLGDRKTGADQAEGSLTGSMGFATKQAGVEKMVLLQYEAAFKAAYPSEPEPMNAKNYGRALQAYQATLATPAPFDRFLGGDDRAIDARQKAGLRTFIDTGCSACHNGALLGGTQYMKFGLVKEYWSATKSKKVDDGRFAVTKKEEDRYVFRVPTLRNVAKTAPYFHDGSVESLDGAVRIMGGLQLGRELDDATVASIIAFLESLTGDVPTHYAAPEAR
ncbi:cytochrome-c peroxidase [Usitatibacter palustris]|uniref:Cytochrome c551 peroxidase n=1 Tax=Usitatibacter palustris TaxID=2732487 RepID=A0A6M4H6B4_9PROT|nr:cytochrome c peroxidase [Usitatibacter palustris]QJR15050.1 Cytochrome c551 peroxidase [Usitatibacter palustris]